MLVKLSPGVNFINVLWAAFAPVDPQSVKRYWQLDWILSLLGATGVKAVRKCVGEIEPRTWRESRKRVTDVHMHSFTFQQSRFYTSGFRLRLSYFIAIFYYLPWFCSIKVCHKKLQCNAENAWGNWMCKCAFIHLIRDGQIGKYCSA